MKVFLSASVPLIDRDRVFLETADIIGIREAVKGLVLVLLERNGHLVFGGHPAITPLVRHLFNEADRSPREHVTLYQSALFEQEFPTDNAAFEHIVMVHRFLAIGKEAFRTCVNACSAKRIIAAACSLEVWRV
jgi:hypothetical protein